ncbi:polysaccharide lyase [Antrihabitans stalactiti]|uniref:Polysaccharide lyase-like protein n=1 Tax=Antrihabitans stalactiti TaxID=2584121 RepID=A0A848KLJ4_9NOCA|nr:polysaccharide lyase [Antrihabitans stalactiti]NMN96657.1 hypothetical protein [Antrihabitans stalactiti]
MVHRQAGRALRRWRVVAVAAGIALVSVAAVLTAAAKLPTEGDPAQVLFRGDFETGDFSQWSTCQSVVINDFCTDYKNSDQSLQVQTDVVRQGRYAARFEVRDGDLSFSAGDRSEVSDELVTGGNEGDDRWYQWSTQFSSTFPMNHASQGWGVVGQWHGESDAGSPPVSMNVDVADGQWGLRINRQAAPGVFMSTPVLWKTPLAPGTWQDIKMHIKWSAEDSVGFVELWHNGVRQTFTGEPCAGTDHCAIRTLIPGGGGTYFKMGYYRSVNVHGTGVVYGDAFESAMTESALQKY